MSDPQTKFQSEGVRSLSLNIKLGKCGEKAAAKFLKSKKYRIIRKNYRSSYGEIDIIAKDKKTIVFVEVKTRSSKKYGRGMESINFIKQQKLRKTALHFLQNNKIFFDGLRFDVIDILIKKSGPPEIYHIKNAF